jgi:hypothetical protein
VSFLENERDSLRAKLAASEQARAEAVAELEIRTRQRDYWMGDRNKMRAIFDAAQKEIRLMREAFTPLIAGIDQKSLDLESAIIVENARSKLAAAPAGGKP